MENDALEGMEEGFRDRPRLRARQAGKRGKFWCDICDLDVHGDYGKCPNCGATKPGKIRYIAQGVDKTPARC